MMFRLTKYGALTVCENKANRTVNHGSAQGNEEGIRDSISGRHGERSISYKSGFTVLELLLAATLLALIIYALYSMFDQTQKALHANVAQTDVSEGSRAAVDLMVREIEQMAPTRIPNGTNLYVYPVLLNPMVQDTIDPSTLRTNQIQDIFFTTRFNKEVTGVGYRVTGLDTNGIGVGTLSRFTYTTNASEITSNNLIRAFLPYGNTNGLQRIIDGVVHLRLLPYTRAGFLQTNLFPDILVKTNVYDGLPYIYTYAGNELPAYVELEVGIMEPASLAQMQSMAGNASLVQSYLRKQIGKVHLFRQRIPIRSGTR